jgi:hypothetical protein
MKLVKGQRFNLCTERFGDIKMYVIEDIKPIMGSKGKDTYVIAKQITYQDIDDGSIVLDKVKKCK